MARALVAAVMGLAQRCRAFRLPGRVQHIVRLSELWPLDALPPLRQVKLFQTRYGIRVCDPSFMLGIFREEYEREGVRCIKMHQPSYMEKTREEFAQHIQPKKSTPAEPFPRQTFLAPLDNCGTPIAVDAEEAKSVQTRGYMNLVGGLLWASRNTMPAISFALSQLTRCMKSPSEKSWEAGLHTLQWAFNHRSEGIVFNEEGNRVPMAVRDTQIHS